MKNTFKFSIAAAIVVAVIASSLALAASSLAPGKSVISPTINNISSSSSGAQPREHKVLRIGYFPNINHAQAVIGLGRGDFQKALGQNVQIEPQVFNAGPSAITGLFANQIDVAYIGPNPAINGYVKSNGFALRIISGAASGGAVFVVRNDSGINSVKDFGGKKFASPQLGNTQDVALRGYLLENGYKTRENGGNVTVLPAANPDILTLMIKKEIDGAWVPEPWGAKLVKEANARIFADERDLWPNGDFPTALIVARTDYLNNNPDVIKNLIKANIDETNWINGHQDEAIKIFNVELSKLTGKTLPEDEFKAGFSRLKLTYEPLKEALIKSASKAFDLGFLGDKKPDLSNIYDLTVLNEVLGERGLPQIT